MPDRRTPAGPRLVLPVLLMLAAGAAPAAEQALPDLGPAPGFTLETTAGESVSLAEALERGPAIVEFWATWCGPCRKALPGLQELHDRYAERGVTVLAISTDEPRNLPKVGAMARALGLSFPVLVDLEKRTARLYRVESIPSTFLVDRSGRIRAFHRGYRRGDLELLENELLRLLDDAPAVRP